MLDGRGFGGKFFAEDWVCNAWHPKSSTANHWSRYLRQKVPFPGESDGHLRTRWAGSSDCEDFADSCELEIQGIDPALGTPGSLLQNGT
ncbi:hypothetical protein CEE69_09350 [Rhodopirellula bahusiensis]|uniref:Uncharacterized protein n=1 Tax=Rhodopirellula bahusiensis TaxID=2014065 RepID=A0A2G1W9U3_9BACT|nr:hypothetical protein CEE69_09350 [Rhodopirellula bahusiensis]